MEDLVEKKYGLLKFLAIQMAEAAQEHDDVENLKHALFKKKEIEEEERDYYSRVNLLDGLKFQRLAEIAFADAERMNEENKEQQALNLYKQKILYNSSQAYCAEAKQYYENALKQGDLQIPHMLDPINNLLYQIQSKIHTFPEYGIFRNRCQSSGKCINRAQKLEKLLQPFNEFKDFLKEKNEKITSPRKRTARLTKLNKRDKAKLERIIERRT